MRHPDLPIIQPSWPTPSNVVAMTTTQAAGSYHMASDNNILTGSQQSVIKAVGLNSPITRLRQHHGNSVVALPCQNPAPAADAAYTRTCQQGCAVITADCLPILITDQPGTVVAAVHAGWRSLHRGIIKNTIYHLNTSPDTLMAWIGPGISQAQYDVDNQLREQFLDLDPTYHTAFVKKKKWHFCLRTIAAMQLNAIGIQNVYHSLFCTYEDQRFYSYRRDGRLAGRMLTLIFIQ